MLKNIKKKPLFVNLTVFIDFIYLSGHREMNINFLLQGFSSYLENLEKISNKRYNIGSNDTSIFMYSQEFQNYIQDELGANNTISSMKITDLLNMDVVNGKLVNSNSQDTDNAGVNDILNDLFNDKSVIEALDKSKDGKLDENEINEFLNNIKNYDSKGKNISLDDIFAATQAIQNGTYGQEEQTPSVEPEATNEPTNGTNSTDSTGSKKSGGTDGSKSPSSPTSSPDTSGVDNLNASNNNLENLSVEELEAKKTEKEGELKTAQNDVDAVYSGENENVKKAQDDADEAKEDYDKKLEEDEQVSQELKDKKAENDTKIAASEGKINTLESDINKKENEITAQKSEIDADNSNISALESALSSLKSQSSDDEKTQAEINSKIASVQTQLEEAKAKLEKDEQKLADLETEKSNLEDDLAAEKETLSGLEEEKAAIEAEILKTCNPETKEAMEKYNEARDNISTVKADELEKAKAAVNTKQAELDEINNQLNVKRAEKTKNDNSVNSLDNPQELYKTLGLDKQGLDYKIFESALKGYKNLMKQQKDTNNSGILAIFDTTTKQVYSIDLVNGKFREKRQVVLGSGVGNMSDVEKANRDGSHATLSGFFQVGDIYNSGKHKTGWTQGIRVYGLEEGINDNCYSKACVIHPTNANST